MAFNVHDVRAIAIVLSLIATLAVAARFRVRKLKKVKYGVDDWTILILTWGLAIMMLRGSVIGVYGAYLPATAPITVNGPMQTVMKFHFATWLMTIACVGVIKISVLLLYRRLFFAERIFYIYVTCLCVAVALWAVGFFFARIFMCGADISAFWNGRMECTVFPVSNGFGISDIVTDGLVVISPMPIVWRLHLPKLQRAGVIGIFALGFLSTAVGAARGYIVITANHEVKKNPIHPVVLGTKVAVYSIIEITVAITAACLITLRPLVSGEHAKGFSRTIKSAISPLLHSSSSNTSKDDPHMDFDQLHDNRGCSESSSESHAQV